jgi:hypothetical protein
MMLAFLQLAALTSDAPPAAPATAADDCNRSRGADIVICGSRGGQKPYRLPKLPQRYDPKQIRAETNVIPGVQTRPCRYRGGDARRLPQQPPDGDLQPALLKPARRPYCATLTFTEYWLGLHPM